MDTLTRSFIPYEKIETLIEQSLAEKGRVRTVLEKARELKGLEPEECAVLLNAQDPELIQEIFNTARFVKDTIYGKRLVFFAPLYLSNYCTNNCTYCGFRAENKEMVRHASSQDEIREQVTILEKQGHKRLMVLTGEHPVRSSLDYLIESLETIYNVKTENGEIRRINVEIAPLSIEEFSRLKKAKIGTYVCFQETYHPEVYDKIHPYGPKSDYYSRLHVMDKAVKGGIDDYGIGALYGLTDHRFEVLSLLYHARHMDNVYGVGPHTISVPRLEPAQNAPTANNVPHPVSDIEFKKIVAILRCAVPYTGIILTTREKPEIRAELLDLGISQISAGSRTSPKGYSEEDENAQFALGDHRSLEEVILDVVEHGYIPSFCTGCYRKGRVGKDFMDLAKPGLINLHCLPNALFTFMEYLEDYASKTTYIKGRKVVADMIKQIKNSKVQKNAEETIARIEKGERDLYF